jgi:transcription-repair coupling factor (superfamily II helicase)
MAKRRTKAGAQQALEEAPLMPTGALAVALLGFAETARPVVHVARDARRLEDLAATLRAPIVARDGEAWSKGRQSHSG